MHRTVCRIISSLVLCLLMPSVWAFEIERVSVSSAGQQANEKSINLSISANGRFVAFLSEASNLVAGDTNGFQDVFVHDRDTGITERVSVPSTGQQANGHSFSLSISVDGRFVAFGSGATNLVEGDTNATGDVFVHDRDTGITERVSVSSAGVQSDLGSSYPSISADGRVIAFVSRARNLVQGNTRVGYDIFVHDRSTDITEQISKSPAGEQGDLDSYRPSISADGRFVVFESDALNLVADDINYERDIFVHDRDTGIIERVSVSSAGLQGNRDSQRSSISADGRFVTFESGASNLAKRDSNGVTDIFVHDRNSGTTERVSMSSDADQGNRASFNPSISANGRYTTFSSYATNLVADGFIRGSDIFVHDRNTGITELISVSSAGEPGDDFSNNSSISADGRVVAFKSFATNLVAGDTNGEWDIFVTENNLLKIGDDLSISLRRTSGATLVGEYIHFRARLTNTTDKLLTNCNVSTINPLVNGRREFSFFSWPLNVANPVTNGRIDIAPGETGQFTLAVLPRVAMRQEIRFIYACDSTKAFHLPYLNTVHLTAKTEPLINEDFVSLSNAYPKTQLVIDRDNGKYWSGYTLNVQNNGAQPARVNLSATSDLLNVPVRIRVPFFCEPADPVNGDWSCLSSRAQQLQVDLAAGQSKKIRVYVHAYRAFEKDPTKHRIIVEAFDLAGDIVAKTSIGVSTLD